jgi:5-methylcytosine-specific restriction endonuclease McrA
MAEKRQVEREARRVERAKRRAALVTVTEKKCPCCHQVLNSDAFPIDVTKPDHLTTMCGICKRTGRNKTPRLQDECKHCHAVKPIEEFELRTGRIKRGRVCRECRLYYLKTKHKEYKSNDPIAYRIIGAQRMRKWTSANREVARQRSRHQRIIRPDFVNARLKRWRANNPSKVKVDSHLRRARKLAAPGVFTQSHIKDKFKLQEGLCYYCYCNISDYYEIEHKIPLARGGSNWPANICLSCKSCNRRKHSKTPKEFKQYLQEN